MSTDHSGLRRPQRPGERESVQANPYPWWDEKDDVDGLLELYEALGRAETIRDYSFILGNHLSWGNRKIADHVATYSITSAHDCPNIGTEYCQVTEETCYAARTEHTYEETFDYRRRQEVLWDHLDAETFTRAFEAVVDRKRNPVTALRVNQAGDVRHRGDVIKLNSIARSLATDHDIETYIYTASSWIPWDEIPTDSITINASDDREPLASEADRFYTALPAGVDPDDDAEVVDHIDDDAIQCPYDATDGAHKCGSCRLCLNDDAQDVYIRIH